MAGHGLTAAEAGRIYALFARLFVREVDPAFAAVLAGEAGAALLPGVDVSDPGLDEDFARITVFDAIPYASFYLRDDGRIEAGLDNPLIAFYRDYGFEADLAEARAVSADHLGVALELAARLCALEAGGADAARAVRRRLVAEQLAPWAPVYLLTVQRIAHTAVYREGAAALLDWLLQDLAALEAP